MECNIYREAISALLDGEPSPLPQRELERHLAECAACRSWQHRAAELTRTLRVRSVEPTPDLTRLVLQAALSPRHARRWPRILLGGIGLCQIALGTAQAVGMGQHDPRMGADMAGHLFHEGTSWNLALGVGFVWVAWRLSAASGLLPVLSVFLAVLTGFSILDLAHGAVSVNRLATHSPLVLGLIALVMVWCDPTLRRPRPGDALAAEHTTDTTTVDGTARVDQPNGRYLGPTGYRRAG